MKAWILKSFASLSKEESEKRFEDTDEDSDSIISRDEYKRAEFDLNDDEGPLSERNESNHNEIVIRSNHRQPSTRFVREANSSNPILCRVVSIHSVQKSEKKCNIELTRYYLFIFSWITREIFLFLPKNFVSMVLIEMVIVLQVRISDEKYPILGFCSFKKY